MSAHNRVIWSEGLFLQPQHFQQQERYLERYVETRCQALVPHSWGFTEIEFERDFLSIGKAALRRAAGVFPDGTPFRMPDDDPLPAPIDIGPDVRDQILYLAVPLRRAGELDADRDAGRGRTGAARRARVAGAQCDGERRRRGAARSGRAAHAAAAGEDVTPRLRLRAARARGRVPRGQAGRARRDLHPDRPAVRGRRPAGRRSPPSCSGCSISAAKRSPGGSRRPAEARAAEFADFLMLQAINRYEPLLAHYAESGRSPSRGAVSTSACRRRASWRPSRRRRSGRRSSRRIGTIACASRSTRSSRRCANR